MLAGATVPKKLMKSMHISLAFPLVRSSKEACRYLFSLRFGFLSSWQQPELDPHQMIPCRCVWSQKLFTCRVFRSKCWDLSFGSNQGQFIAHLHATLIRAPTFIPQCGAFQTDAMRDHEKIKGFPLIKHTIQLHTFKHSRSCFAFWDSDSSSCSTVVSVIPHECIDVVFLPFSFQRGPAGEIF